MQDVPICFTLKEKVKEAILVTLEIRFTGKLLISNCPHLPINCEKKGGNLLVFQLQALYFLAGSLLCEQWVE